VTGRIDREILAVAARDPGALAVACDDRRLDYGELRRRALAVARDLVDRGLEGGDRVLLDATRDLDTLPAMLGIWLAGGVLVPLPAATPTPQVRAICDDAAPRALVGPPALAHALGLADPLVVDPHRLAEAPDFAPRPRDEAYILYTSGTTGRPKGVVGTHPALHQYLEWQAAEFANDAGERFSQIAPISFDFALKELLVPLLRGASVWFVPDALRLDGRALLRWFAERRITSACCMPLVFRELTAALAGLPADARPAALGALRRLHVSGDMLYWQDVDRWRAACPRPVELVNMYGPTESTIIKAFHRLPTERPAGADATVPVGRALPDARLLVLGPDGAPVPAGELGEVYIESPWLARGYTDPELTAQRFTVVDGARRYRTGDLGRLDADGLLTLAGRADRQVKIGGVRVELAGVEAVLRPHADDVAVVAPALAGDRELVCFFTAASPAAEQTLRAAAARDLSPAEAPRRFVGLDALPRTHNGKIDRDRLLQLASEPPAARAELEPLLERVTALWTDLLRVAVVAPDANFFELGGDSMQAISLLRAIRQTFNVRLRLADMLGELTPRGITRRLEQRGSAPTPS
jgi:amino acid adenylation domain-containing protein